MKSPLEHESISDSEVHVRKIGKEFSDIRKPHLEVLQPLVDHAKTLTDLPLVYDVTRLHPPAYTEFSFTEFLGCLYISPQSIEVATRLVDHAANHDTEYDNFNIVQEIFKRQDFEPTLDKYSLNNTELSHYPSKIIFTPGDNIFKPMISREILTRVMVEHEDCMIKPHPMSSNELIRFLGREFGYRRIIEPSSSGWHCLMKAETVYCSTSTELGIYAGLLNKEIINIGNFFNECRGAYSPFYRIIWNLDKSERQDALTNILNSPYSGVFHPKDPDVKKKMQDFFSLSADIRKYLKPMAYEIGPTEWADIQMSKLQVKDKEVVVPTNR